ncbi:MAG: hypothetical protein AAF585_03130 [Verrucomicrobiota bacterium]
MWVRNSPASTNSLGELDEQWEIEAAQHSEVLLRQLQNGAAKGSFAVAALALERTMPVYRDLMESKDVARKHQGKFYVSHKAIWQWIREDIEIKSDLLDEVKFGFVLQLGDPLSAVYHAFSEQARELVKQIVAGRPHPILYPVVNSFDVIRAFVSARLKDGETQQNSEAVGIELLEAESTRQTADANRLVKAGTSKEVTSELYERAKGVSILGSQRFPGLV